ncbi:hypothetical protein F5141DRAFT_1068718 [Pisolithus sp. B1]|nr:hypothetical protein F5141DRAFT_1068718 [Pisolithus sp. B1]
MAKEFANSKFWAMGSGHNQYKWTCLAHKDNKCTLATWLANGDDLIVSDGEESDSPQECLADDFNPAGCSMPTIAWFPWPDKQTCILDILWHLPRSLFSDMQLHVFLWGLSVLGVDSIPSTRMLKDLVNSLQSQYRVPLIHYQGSLSYVYYVNHLPFLITQEMANPHIHMHIHHYPEDAALRWLHEIDPSIAMPMICKGQQDFYVFELTKLTDGTMVVPEHWYTKPSIQHFMSPSDLEYWAHAWQTQPIASGGASGYMVHRYNTVKVTAN